MLTSWPTEGDQVLVMRRGAPTTTGTVAEIRDETIVLADGSRWWRDSWRQVGAKGRLPVLVPPADVPEALLPLHPDVREWQREVAAEAVRQQIRPA